MKIVVKLFAALREEADAASLPLELPSGATVADALHALTSLMPSLAHNEALALAINHTYVDRAAVLADGDELALIPPVSGG